MNVGLLLRMAIIAKLDRDGKNTTNQPNVISGSTAATTIMPQMTLYQRTTRFKKGDGGIINPTTKTLVHYDATPQINQELKIPRVSTPNVKVVNDTLNRLPPPMDNSSEREVKEEDKPLLHTPHKNKDSPHIPPDVTLLENNYVPYQDKRNPSVFKKVFIGIGLTACAVLLVIWLLLVLFFYFNRYYQTGTYETGEDYDISQKYPLRSPNTPLFTRLEDPPNLYHYRPKKFTYTSV